MPNFSADLIKMVGLTGLPLAVICYMMLVHFPDQEDKMLDQLDRARIEYTVSLDKQRNQYTDSLQKQREDFRDEMKLMREACADAMVNQREDLGQLCKDD